MNLPARDLTKHLYDPTPGEAETRRLWSNLEARLGPAPRRSRAARTAAAFTLAALGCAAAVLLFMRTTSRTRETGEVAVTSGRATTDFIDNATDAVKHVRLGSGSAVSLAPRAQIRRLPPKAGHVVVALERGSAEFQVAATAGQPLTVVASRVQVRVSGAQFRVALVADAAPDSPSTPGAGTGVEVTVLSGTVAIERGAGHPAEVVTAGASWRSNAVSVVAPTRPASAARISSSARTVPRSAARGGAITATASLSEAESIFADADRAFIAGRVSEAVTGFDLLRRRFPRHPAAALATFQLGRIRLDTLHDPQGALQAFRQARAMAGANASFLDDLDARIVDALGQLGDREACRAARAQYLADHPRGNHAVRVRASCGGP